MFSGPTSTKKKLCGNFLTTPFTLKSRKISLSLTNDLQLNKNCWPLLKISSLPHLEICVFTFNLKSTNLTTQIDQSFLPAVVPPYLFPAIQTKLWHPSSKLYRLTLRTENTHLKFFVTLIPRIKKWLIVPGQLSKQKS